MRYIDTIKYVQNSICYKSIMSHFHFLTIELCLLCVLSYLHFVLFVFCFICILSHFHFVIYALYLNCILSLLHFFSRAFCPIAFCPICLLSYLHFGTFAFCFLALCLIWILLHLHFVLFLSFPYSDQFLSPRFIFIIFINFHHYIWTFIWLQKLPSDWWIFISMMCFNIIDELFSHNWDFIKLINLHSMSFCKSDLFSS